MNNIRRESFSLNHGPCETCRKIMFNFFLCVCLFLIKRLGKSPGATCASNAKDQPGVLQPFQSKFLGKWTWSWVEQLQVQVQKKSVSVQAKPFRKMHLSLIMGFPLPLKRTSAEVERLSGVVKWSGPWSGQNGLSTSDFFLYQMDTFSTSSTSGSRVFRFWLGKDHLHTASSFCSAHDVTHGGVRRVCELSVFLPTALYAL